MAGSTQSRDSRDSRDAATNEEPKNDTLQGKRRGQDSFISFWVLIRPRVGVKRFFQDLVHVILKDGVLDNAAVVAYFTMLAIFPAAILGLSLLPYLPIPALEETMISTLYRVMPGQAAALFTSTVSNVVSERHGGLLSFGALGAVWAASSGLQVIMERLHAIYEANETRPYWKMRLIAIGLVFVVGVLIVGAFTLVIVGELIQKRLSYGLGANSLTVVIFSILRWTTILLMLLGAVSLVYYFGPSVRLRYRLCTPGSLLAAILSVVASLGLSAYVDNFGSYEATYGSLGAVIVLLLWLYVGGLVLLIGAEVDGLLERYAQSSREYADYFRELVLRK